MELSVSLLTFFLSHIEDLEVVVVDCGNSVASLINFIHAFSHTSVIIEVGSSVVHNFNSTLFKN